MHPLLAKAAGAVKSNPRKTLAILLALAVVITIIVLAVLLNNCKSKNTNTNNTEPFVPIDNQRVMKVNPALMGGVSGGFNPEGLTSNSNGNARIVDAAELAQRAWYGM